MGLLNLKFEVCFSYDISSEVDLGVSIYSLYANNASVSIFIIAMNLFVTKMQKVGIIEHGK